MNRGKRVWSIICLITALSVLFVVMTEARLSRFPKPLVRRENVHVLTERKHVPDLAFFWHIGQEISRDSIGLSDEQKIQLKEAFWDLYFQTFAIQEEASDNASMIPGKMARLTQMGRVFADYLKTLDDIFTPGQQNQHRKHFPPVKSPGQFWVVTNFRTHLTTSGALAEMKYARSQSHAAEAAAEITQQYAWATLAQVSMHIPLHHDLSQLQILRL